VHKVIKAGCSVVFKCSWL